MILKGLLALTMVATAGVPSTSPVARVGRIVPVVAVEGARLSLAGEYTSTPNELRMPALSGENLYLFTDGTYIYTEWADILPVTIFDKGTWKISIDQILLTSDSSITWKVHNDHVLTAIRRITHEREVLLLGDRGLEYFEAHAHDSPDDPEFMLLINVLTLAQHLGATKGTELKFKLLRDAWRPTFFDTATNKRPPN